MTTQITSSPGTTRPRVAIVLEQTLGHVTHAKNLVELLTDHPDVDAVFLPVAFDRTGWARRIPGYGNWTVRAGIRSRRQVRAADRVERFDAMFVHTQVPAILLGRWMRRIPTIVSVDATPEQYDELGDFYAHDRSAPWLERVKKSMARRCFNRANHMVAWSRWAAEGLVAEYGVDRDRVTVIAPGVNIGRWTRNTSPSEHASNDPLIVLFVGGDMERKGGHLLIEATRRLASEADIPPFEVHMVTNAKVDAEMVTVHAGLTPNSSELLALYHRAAVFCLPTLGDCLPMVLSEAAAAGLALISTDVGAIDEIVIDGVTGRLVAANDIDQLTDALRQLLTDRARRDEYAAGAFDLARRQFDARHNAEQLVALLRDAASSRHR